MFDRQALKAWRTEHLGHRSLTVLRQPLVRVHGAFCEYLEKAWMGELSYDLKSILKFGLPSKGAGFAGIKAHRAGFLKFLEMTTHLRASRTELRPPPHLASQAVTITGFSVLQAPDYLLREDRLAEGLAFVCAEAGVTMQSVPDVAERQPFALADLYGPNLEAACREVYARDYTALGFGDWR